MHEVAQVVAAGHAVSPETESAAVIAKMLRVMMLAPFLLILSIVVSRQVGSDTPTRQPIVFPWFALLFILVALFNSLHLLPVSWVAAINAVDNVLLATAMAALGMTTRISQLMKAGLRPFLLGLMLFAWLVIGGGTLNLMIRGLSVQNRCELKGFPVLTTYHRRTVKVFRRWRCVIFGCRFNHFTVSG